MRREHGGVREGAFWILRRTAGGSRCAPAVSAPAASWNRLRARCDARGRPHEGTPSSAGSRVGVDAGCVRACVPTGIDRVVGRTAVDGVSAPRVGAACVLCSLGRRFLAAAAARGRAEYGCGPQCDERRPGEARQRRARGRRGERCGAEGARSLGGLGVAAARRAKSERHAANASASRAPARAALAVANASGRAGRTQAARERTGAKLAAGECVSGTQFCRLCREQGRSSQVSLRSLAGLKSYVVPERASRGIARPKVLRERGSFRVRTVKKVTT